MISNGNVAKLNTLHTTARVEPCPRNLTVHISISSHDHSWIQWTVSIHVHEEIKITSLLPEPISFKASNAVSMVCKLLLQENQYNPRIHTHKHTEKHTVYKCTYNDSVIKFRYKSIFTCAGQLTKYAHMISDWCRWWCQNLSQSTTQYLYNITPVYPSVQYQNSHTGNNLYYNTAIVLWSITWKLSI